jgi:hypothetical protein
MTRMMRVLCVALLTVAGLGGSSLPARADDRDNRCEKRIHQAEDKLRDAVQRHGEDSKQARKRRQELEEVKRQCPDHHDMDHHDHDHDQH